MFDRKSEYLHKKESDTIFYIEHCIFVITNQK